MYFEITTSPTSRLPVSTEIDSGVWLHRIHNTQFLGYRLGNHGGNFVEFDLTVPCINFGFYKDFTLTNDPTNGILLSNINPTLTALPNSIISAKIINSKINFIHYNLNPIFKKSGTQTKDHVINSIKSILLENLNQIRVNLPLQIAYSGGLDSSTLAWIAHANNLEFTAIVDPLNKLPTEKLPFRWENDSLMQFDGRAEYVWDSKIVSHFYQRDCIGGFYGDIALLHIRDLYYQSEHLIDIPIDGEHYDREPKTGLLVFQNYNAMISAIIKWHLTPQFRQWFDNFEIFDVYRDPRLFEAVLTLSRRDLLLQFKTAFIQKAIVKDADINSCNFICDYKNDYSKF